MLEMLMGGRPGDEYPDSGPGPKNLKHGDTDAGYFGMLTPGELFTATEVLAATGLAATNTSNANLMWCKFYWKGKVVYYPTQFLFNDQAWTTLNNNNIVYSNANTRTISKTVNGVARKFRIRLPAASTIDPAALTISPSAEFFALFAKVLAGNIANAVWATAAWDNIAEPIARINRYTPTQTTYSADVNQAIWVAFNNSLVNAAKSSDPAQNDRGCIPVLELVDLRPTVPLPAITGPGPTELAEWYINPDNPALVNGYFGLVPRDDLISGRNLETALGFNAGTGVSDTGGWFKFYLDGKILFIPKTPLRRNLSYASLYQAGLVYGTDDNGVVPIGAGVNQRRTVTINGLVYIVRLLKGTTGNNILVRADLSQLWMHDYPATTNSEYSRTMNNVISNISAAALKTGGTWDTRFTAADLGYEGSSYNYGYLNWCQEQELSAAGNYLARGATLGAMGMGVASATATDYYSWRPVLELVGPA